MLDQARTLLNELASADPAVEPKALGAKWKDLHALLKKAPCDQMRLARFIAERNVDSMRELLEVIAKAPPPAPRTPLGGVPGAGAPAPRQSLQPQIMVRAEKPTPQQLKTALAAFKKRLKLTRLDQESRLGRSPLTGGAKSTVVAILPPNLYPKTYWEELEKQGQIRNTGGGFYELVEKAKPIKNTAPEAGNDDSAPQTADEQSGDAADSHASAE